MPRHGQLETWTPFQRNIARNIQHCHLQSNSLETRMITLVFWEIKCVSGGFGRTISCGSGISGPVVGNLNGWPGGTKIIRID
jgi:hypothetical protein